MRIRLILMALLLLTANFGHALEATKESALSPMKLSATYWEDLIESSGSTEEKIARLIQSIKETPGGLDDKTHVAFEASINQIIANAKTYLAANIQPTAEVPTIYTIKDRYTLDEFMDLALDQMRLENTIKNQVVDLKQIEDSIAQTNHDIDQNWVTYLAMKESAEKFAMGLEIISDRLLLEIKKDFQSNLKIKLNSNEALAHHLEEEIEHASKLISFDDAADSQWNQRLEILENASHQAAQNLSNAYSRLTLSFDGSAVSENKNALQSLNVTNLSILQGVATGNLLIESIQKGYIALKLAGGKFSNVEAQKNLHDWRRQIDDLQKEAEAWGQKLSEEQNKLRQTVLQIQEASALDQSELQILIKNLVQSMQEAYLNLNQLGEKIFLATFLIQHYQALEEAGNNPLMVGILKLWSWSVAGWEAVQGWIYFPLFKIAGIPITLFSGIEVAFIIGLGMVISRFICSGLRQIARRRLILRESAFYTLERLIHYVILLAAAIIALSKVGFDFSSIALIAGALSVGIGFGLQSIVRDFINGLFILFTQNFRVGDIVELSSSTKGKIKSINVQNTIVEHADGSDLVIPNSEMVDQVVHNWTMSNVYRRLHIPFFVAYGNEKEEVSRIIIEAAKKVPYTVSGHPGLADPQVWLVSFGQRSVNFELVVWVNQMLSYSMPPNASYLWEIDTALRSSGLRSSPPTPPSSTAAEA